MFGKKKAYPAPPKVGALLKKPPRRTALQTGVGPTPAAKTPLRTR
jgi:hypothetical protein